MGWAVWIAVRWLTWELKRLSPTASKNTGHHTLDCATTPAVPSPDGHGAWAVQRIVTHHPWSHPLRLPSQQHVLRSLPGANGQRKPSHLCAKSRIYTRHVWPQWRHASMALALGFACSPCGKAHGYGAVTRSDLTSEKRQLSAKQAAKEREARVLARHQTFSWQPGRALRGGLFWLESEAVGSSSVREGTPSACDRM